MHRMWVNVISPLMTGWWYSVSWIIFFPFPQTRTCMWLETFITMLEEPEIHTCTVYHACELTETAYNMYVCLFMHVSVSCKYNARDSAKTETRIFGWVEGWKKNLTGDMRKAAYSHSHRSKEFSLSDKDLVILQWIISIGLRVSESSQHTVC